MQLFMAVWFVTKYVYDCFATWLCSLRGIMSKPAHPPLNSIGTRNQITIGVAFGKAYNGKVQLNIKSGWKDVGFCDDIYYWKQE